MNFGMEVSIFDSSLGSVNDYESPFIKSTLWANPRKQWRSEEPSRVLLWCRRPRFNPCVRKIPWRKKWQSILVFLLGEFHGRRSPAGYSPWAHKESDMTEWLHCRGTWCATACEVAKRQKLLSDWTSISNHTVPGVGLRAFHDYFIGSFSYFQEESTVLISVSDVKVKTQES